MPDPDPASDERMLVTLGEGVSGGADFSTGRKKGSFCHDGSGGAGGGGGGGAGATGCAEAPGREALLKNCVNPPSADAESETPGEENPFDFDGPEDGAGGRGGSSDDRGGVVCSGVTPETKMRVNSPGACSAAGCGCGTLTT